METIDIVNISINMWFWIFFMIFIFTSAGISYRNRNKVRNRIILKHLGLSSIERIPDNYFPIRYSNEDRFNRLWKYFPWEGAGWITIKKRDLVFLTEHNQEVIEKQLPLNRTSIEWIGPHSMRNGTFSWIKVEYDNKKYYITNETGLLAIGSKKGTKKIFEYINNKS